MNIQEQKIKDFLNTKPKTINVIAYGSAIKKQNRDKNLKKQIDLILGVKEAKKWHKENQNMNPKDYTFIGYHFLTKMPSKITNAGTNINYLAYLTHNKQEFKIGVIDNDLLISDLLNWDNGYMAGRTQKSIKLIKGTEEIKKAIQKNRENALKIALILLKENELTEEMLLEKICGLSYDGDIRMRFKMENPNKVKDIVIGSYDELKKLYDQVNYNYFKYNENNIIVNYKEIIHNFNDIPSNLKNNIDMPKDTDLETLKLLRKQIKKFIYHNNLKTGLIQPVKGTITNGMTKTLIYAKTKRKKHNAYK